MKRHHLAPIVALLVAVHVVGCRKDATSPPLKSTDPPAAPSQVGAPREAQAGDVVVRIRKLGGPGGKQVLNQLNVPTPLGEEFNVTEQVGATQLAFSGRVEDLRNGEYRVRYKYVETSAAGAKQLQSTVELPLDHEKPLGGLVASEGENAPEQIMLGLSRP